jgi:hypothetical protein
MAGSGLEAAKRGIVKRRKNPRRWMGLRDLDGAGMKAGTGIAACAYQYHYCFTDA